MSRPLVLTYALVIFLGWLVVWAVWQALARRSQLRRLLSGVRLTKLLGQQSFGGIDVANA